MSPGGTATATCAAHGALSEQAAGLRRDVDRHEGEIRQLVNAVAEIRGAWRMAVVMGSLAGGVAAAVVAGAIELLLRTR